MMSKEELEGAHRKALKVLDGEKRAAIKKAKGTKGKKAKEAIAALEAEFDTKQQELEKKYQEALAQLGNATTAADAASSPKDTSEPSSTATTTNETTEKDEDEEDAGLSQKQKKQLKARRKKERQKEREQQRQKEIEELNATAGPSLRDTELEQLQTVLSPLQMKIVPVTADGHCLYRSVAAQLELEQPEPTDGTPKTYLDIRSLCADTLALHREEFEPFCEYNNPDEVSNFDAYVDQVRHSAEWGGHLELRAISIGLQRSIQVYSVPSGSQPLTIDPPSPPSSETPLRLSYHLHYYALGEHYNHVVRCSETS